MTDLEHMQLDSGYVELDFHVTAILGDGKKQVRFGLDCIMLCRLVDQCIIQILSHDSTKARGHCWYTIRKVPVINSMKWQLMHQGRQNDAA
jgi:hypothetical protein